MINNQLLKKLFDLEFDNTFDFKDLGLSFTNDKNSLSFIDSIDFVNELNNNSNIRGVLVKDKFANLIKNKVCLIVEDPREIFYKIHNYNAINTIEHETVIAKSANIHPTSIVSNSNVTIGENVIIGPFVEISNDVELGANTIIEAGAKIGLDGFEFKKTKNGILRIIHNGKVVIGENVQVGKNTCIDKGFKNRDTTIGNNTKIDNLVHIAHSVNIGENSFIVSGTTIGGSVIIGNDVWLSINTSIAPFIKIGDNAFVSIGAVVTKDVPSGDQVTGNFAITHKTFLKNFKKNLE